MDGCVKPHLVEVFSTHGDLQVMNSIKLHLQTKLCVEQTVRSARYYFGSDRIDGQRRSHSASIQLRRHKHQVKHTQTSEFFKLVFTLISG